MSWIAELESLLPDKVSRTPQDLARCASDKWFASKEPDAVVFAESAADVSAVMSLSARHKIPVTVRGGGVGYVGGCVPINGGIVLAMGGLSSCTHSGRSHPQSAQSPTTSEHTTEAFPRASRHDEHPYRRPSHPRRTPPNAMLLDSRREPF